MAIKELLAPVGSYESMIAAVNAGCDAIYTGGRMFGARAFANNFDNDELINVIRYCHMKNVAVYLTVNTLLSDNEIEGYLFDYIKPLYEAGLDAVIVQDIGVLKFISKHFENLSIHLSTQFTSTTHYSSKLFKEYNVTRVVTPRELSIREIEEYSQNTDLEIETFIHGALCYCYSGQCLMSALIGGRSGNRGKCAQPCRKQYSIDGTKKECAVLSLKDLCALDYIPVLMESSIYSFKIEGRMKKPEYVATVVSIYRKYMDLYEELGNEKYTNSIIGSKEYMEDKTKLLDIYNRGGFTDGYFNEHNSKEINCVSLVSHYGVLCGKVINVLKGEFVFVAGIELNAQDVLQIRDKKQNTIYEFTLKDGVKKGCKYKLRYSRGLLINKDMEVYRIRNNELVESVSEKIINGSKKLPVSMSVKAAINEPIRLLIETNECKAEVEGDICSKALKTPVTDEIIKGKLTKLGNTDFVCDSITVEADDDLFIPMVALNELKRQGIDKLKEKINNKYTRQLNINYEPFSIQVQKRNYDRKVLIYAFNYEVCVNALEFANESIVVIETVNFTAKELSDVLQRSKKLNVTMCLALPSIIRYKNMDSFTSLIEFMDDNEALIDGVMIRNFEALAMLKEAFLKNKLVISDTGMYAYNSIAINSLRKLGVNLVTSPLEHYIENADIVTVYGNRQVMVSAGCVKKTIEKCDKTGEVVYITSDKKDKYFSKPICKYCYNMVFTCEDKRFYEQTKDYINNNHIVRLNFTNEDKTKIKAVMNQVRALLEDIKE